VAAPVELQNKELAALIIHEFQMQNILKLIIYKRYQLLFL
jgi:hypothetical protein